MARDRRITHLRVTSREIAHVTDPDCRLDHQRPCAGCVGYCEINSEERASERGQEYLYDAYGTYECQGVLWRCKTTVWRLTIEWASEAEAGTWVVDGRTEELAMVEAQRRVADYEAACAAADILASPIDG